MAISDEERRRRDRERKRTIRAAEREANAAARVRECPSSVSVDSEARRIAEQLDASDPGTMGAALVYAAQAVLLGKPDAAYRARELATVAWELRALHEQGEWRQRLASLEERLADHDDEG